jgi:hypothetical protein
MAHDVFISHAEEDRAAAQLVCTRLEDDGLRCWIAPRDIQPGADWGGAIVAAIRSSRALVLVFSEHANASRHVPRELERAINHGIPIIPVRIEDVEPRGSLEYSLSSVHWFDALTPPLETHVDRLALTLHSMLGTRPTRQPVVPAAVNTTVVSNANTEAPPEVHVETTASWPRPTRRVVTGVVTGVATGSILVAVVMMRPSASPDADYVLDLTKTSFTIGLLTGPDDNLQLAGADGNLTERDVSSVELTLDENNLPAVSITFKPDAAAKMKALTSANIGRKLGIVRNGKVVQHFTVNNAVFDRAQLSFGNESGAKNFLDALRRDRAP